MFLHEWALFEFEEDKCKGDCRKCFSALEMESRIGVSLIKNNSWCNFMKKFSFVASSISTIKCHSGYFVSKD